jgi:hypothetical protein
MLNRYIAPVFCTGALESAVVAEELDHIAAMRPGICRENLEIASGQRTEPAPIQPQRVRGACPYVLESGFSGEKRRGKGTNESGVTHA